MLTSSAHQPIIHRHNYKTSTLRFSIKKAAPDNRTRLKLFKTNIMQQLYLQIQLLHPHRMLPLMFAYKVLTKDNRYQKLIHTRMPNQ